MSCWLISRCKNGQELALVKVLGLEPWQAVVTDVDGDSKAFAIADGIRELCTCFWSNPERAKAFCHRDQQSLPINRARPLDSRAGLVRALSSDVPGLVYVCGKVVEVRKEQ